ncbi:MAG: N-acetyl-gamma-glutamyl-phosphate reductase [Candidatus Woesearchaeota archaeon]
MEVAIVGGSGYAGGELLRLLLDHPEVVVSQVTSNRFAGKFVHAVHPNLRKRTDLKFSVVEELGACDALFLALPHGMAMQQINVFAEKAKRIIDLSSDFRLRNPEDYVKWYGHNHTTPDMLKRFVYGLVELHRAEIKGAKFVSGVGCNATAVNLGLYPLYKNRLIDESRTVVEVKVGSSEAGNKPSLGSHHPERSGAVRSYAPVHHRHVAEMLQELQTEQIHFSATAIEMVRGILATAHVFLKKELEEKDIWKVYRECYGGEPFVRLVNSKTGIYRYPEPKILAGTNYCDIGFAKEAGSDRVVVMSAIDNLMKGAAGSAVHAMNVMHGFDERTGLGFAGLHP